MTLRRILITLLIIVMTPVCFDLLLHMFDVWGAHRYFDDLNTVWYRFEPDRARGYHMQPGTVTFSNWTMTTLPDGTRLVPDTAPTGCTLATLGDSVTMGHGVNDSDTYTAQLARDFPDIHWINAGVEGYNAAQVLLTRALIPAGGYLYLLIDNDADARVDPIYIPKPFYRPSLPLYLMVWQSQNGMFTGLPQDFPAFDTAMNTLKADDRVSVVGFDGNKLPVRAGVPTIPYWTHVNSFADAHPNAEGHQEIAAGLTPYIAALIDQVCPS